MMSGRMPAVPPVVDLDNVRGKYKVMEGGGVE